MPDRRKHRGPHPADRQLFGTDVWPRLQQAVYDYSWLLTRSYASKSALKLVGDRYQLTERQRLAVMRSSCSRHALDARRQKQLASEDVSGRSLQLDGFNVLTTVEAALAGGVLLSGRDGCIRDMASMHGSYRRVEETRPALIAVGEVLEELAVTQCQWLFDRPVSNSGRLCTMVREVAQQHGWRWTAELVDDADQVLIRSGKIVVSADSLVLDHCGQWFDLTQLVVRLRVPHAYFVPLADFDLGRNEGLGQ